MSEALLVEQPVAVATPPPLNSEDQAKVNMVYKRWEVLGKSSAEKNTAIQKEIQSRKFFAFGGDENIEMELRVNERIYLRNHAKPIWRLL